jgi:hypothetical protein
MDRRTFISSLALGLLAAPLAAEAQQKAMPVIGYLHFASPGLAPSAAVFLQGLSTCLHKYWDVFYASISDRV